LALIQIKIQQMPARRFTPPQCDLTRERAIAAAELDSDQKNPLLTARRFPPPRTVEDIGA
jgi:hypothetical protein